MLRNGLLFNIFLVLCVDVLYVDATAEDAIDFNRDVRPILSNNCFACHGPDDAQRKAGLRLDKRDDALARLDSGLHAIVPSDPEQSVLLRRVTSDDADFRMPPSGQLTPREIETLSAWVAQDADYATHWAYVKPERPPLPEVPSDWPENAVDVFVLDRLGREGLTPAPRADREALARRVALDLTGLPPMPGEVAAFVEDDSPEAYTKFVDQMLSKPAFGEHWARLWLDLARYADSAGYANDVPRTIWAYRDYVVRSLNANKPFDCFTIEQIAGDLLDDSWDAAPLGVDAADHGAHYDRLIATAFHRNTQTNTEGGTNDEEYRNVAVVDRVNTTMAVWMGTTMNCAQCHSHKYDPITQEEYFRFFAVFNNTLDNDQLDESPLLSVWTLEQERQKDSWKASIAELEGVVTTATAELIAARDSWDRSFPDAPTWSVLRPEKVSLEHGGPAQIADDGSVFVPEGQEKNVYSVEAAPALERITAFRLDVLPHDDLPEKGAGHGGGNFVITRILVDISSAGDKKRSVPIVAAHADFTQNDWSASGVLDGKDHEKTGWAVSPEITRAHRLTLVPESPVVARGDDTVTVTIEQRSAYANHKLGHFRLSVTDDDTAVEHDRTPVAIFAILKTPADKRSAEQEKELTKYYVSIAPALDPQRAELANLKKKLSEEKPFTTVPVMRAVAEKDRRKTLIQRRGNYLETGAEVSAGVPAVFHALPKERTPDRLTLAHWLVDENNPLTARVLANRLWQAVFGVGLVRTSEEFGAQGELPTHPELLSWLAMQVVESGWDLKHMLRLLVTSSTYRQASHVSAEEFERDPENRLLARGPRFRLSAEMVRDQALFASGLLSSKMYGAPVHPMQPDSGLVAAFGGTVDWKTSEGTDKYRRGLYVTWRRSSPYPSMATFDAPNREVCEVRRARTNTPLQALVTLNDPVYVEAAQSLARRIAHVKGNTSVKARHGFRLCVARDPSDVELASLVALYADALTGYARDLDQARSMATDPLGPVPAGSDVAELAAWTVVGNVLLNLDEMFMKR